MVARCDKSPPSHSVPSLDHVQDIQAKLITAVPSNSLIQDSLLHKKIVRELQVSFEMDDFIVIPVEFLGNAVEVGVFGDWIVGILFVIHVSQLSSIWG